MELLIYKAALVGVLGIGAQWLAWRFNLPAIVLMSVAGLIAGPALGVLDPAADLGDLFQPIISMAVAIILFEGGLNLDIKEIRHSGHGVGRLVIPGVPIAWALGAIAAHHIAGLSWPVAILFAGIMVVTGPTVIVPLLRQANLASRPRTLLKWEGIINDPIGAILAVMTYEYLAYSGEGNSLTDTAMWIGLAVLVAIVIGYLFAQIVAYAFPRGYVPEYLKAPVLLIAVLLCFAAANAVEHEMGLLSVTVMGMALANSGLASISEMRRFKETVSVLLISGVFVLLTASLSVEVLTGLDWRFLGFVLAMLFLVRPASVLISTLGTDLGWNERFFLGWVAPRGIVAVAVSGLFALRLAELGYPDGELLIPLSFAMVFATILAHGFTAGWLAQKLDIASHAKKGVLIVGSSAWSVELAKTFRELDIPVSISDTSWRRLRNARLADIPTFYGEILSEHTEHRINLNRFGYLLAVSGNEAYNALVSMEFAPDIGRANVYQLGATEGDDPHGLSHTVRGQTLFKSGMALDELLRRHFANWSFQRTKLSEKFTFENYLGQRPEESEILYVVKKNGDLAFATAAARPKVEAGDIIVAYSPPQQRDELPQPKTVSEVTPKLPA